MQKESLGANSEEKGVSTGLVRVMLVIFWLTAVSTGPISALAQTEDPIILQTPNTIDFPTVKVPFKLPTAHKDLNSGLQLSHIKIIENGEFLQPGTLSEEHAGVNFTLAINPSRQMDWRDVNGRSPYDKLRDALIEWAETRSSFLGDKWSFVSDTGIEINNASDRKIWTDSLAAYQPNFRVKEPQLDSFERAINLFSERVVPFGVDKSLLYVTPALLPSQLDAFAQLATQAKSAGIQVNIWYVDDPYFLTNDQGGLLTNLVDETGGNFLFYTGIEVIPNPESYREELGTFFELIYQSKIRETGSFQLQIEITMDKTALSGESVPFYVEVEAPNPILISPPMTITRTETEEEEDVFSPSSQLIKIMVEFPDSHPRPIISSRLIVDGNVADERDAPPFDVLVWDLESYTESGKQHIQVEVTDSLGLSSKTIETPVEIEIVQITAEEQPVRSQTGLILLSVVFSIASISFAIWLIRHFWQSGRFKAILPKRFGEDKPSGMLISKPSIPKNQIHALLIPLGLISNQQEDAFNLTHSQIKIGSDPVRSSLILKDSSIEGLHALIIQYEGEFWINDLGSNEGTWVNYARIGKQPVRIHPGDVLYFGQCGFRFTIPEHLQTSHVFVSKYEPIL